MKYSIKVIIPALNEEKAVGPVVSQLLALVSELNITEVIVVNNDSTDQTATVASAAGATVLEESIRGYGKACLKGIAYLKQLPPEQQPDIVAFIDADGSDYPEELTELITPMVNQNYDMVIGSRALGEREQGAMTIPQVFGNWLATTLIRWIYGVQFTDLGPFRTIKWQQLLVLDMQDVDFGWTVEMQVKAAKRGLKSTEVAVNYRRRKAGKSKVSGTIRGTFLAGHKILWTIFREAFSKNHPS
ncbi:MAG: glycosyltransferase family 2 protein [Chitinophagales bacterium]